MIYHDLILLPTNMTEGAAYEVRIEKPPSEKYKHKERHFFYISKN